MSIDHFLKKLVSASDGPLLAEKLADEITSDIIKYRKGKKNVFKSYAKSKRTKKFENLETAILRIMRQTTDLNRERYSKVVDRMHCTGMDTLFSGPIPIPIKSATDLANQMAEIVVDDKSTDECDRAVFLEAN